MKLLSYLLTEHTEMNISNVNYINKFNILKILKDQVLIGGSSTMALFGIRPNKDIDAIITSKLWNKLQSDKNFKEDIAYPNRESSRYLYHKNVPQITLFKIDYPLGYTAEEGIRNSNISFNVNGFYFETLQHLIKWKKAMRRPKDLNDIKLIKDFLQKEK